MKALYLSVIAVILIACGGSGTTGFSNPTQANPCATPGATYGFSFSERPDGTCGPISDQLVIVDKGTSGGGTISGPALVCRSSTLTGCRIQNNDCAISGTSCRLTTDVTFAQDGSSAAGYEMLVCSDCVSTYHVLATRL